MKIFSRFILVILENHSKTLDNNVSLKSETREQVSPNDSTKSVGVNATITPRDTVSEDVTASGVPKDEVENDSIQNDSIL